LARVVGHPEWIHDERFSSVEARARNAVSLIALLDAIFATKTREEWGDVFATEEDMWWAPVLTTEEVLADPQVHAAGGLVAVPDGDGTTLLPATPCDFHGTPWEPRSMAPEHGQHSDEILRELGRTREEIEALRKASVIG
jgi:crotonobetainyl-CoA:carnitine CoA-transferase CaiB-like acyl-CoA transferase